MKAKVPGAHKTHYAALVTLEFRILSINDTVPKKATK